MLRRIVRTAAFVMRLEVIVLVGCSEGTPDGSDPADAGEDAPRADGSMQVLDADGAESFRDRCFGEACELAVLPEQTERPFLEDVGDGWQRLIETDWQLGPGSEGYRCVSKTMPRDVYIVAFSPLAPPGTHHVSIEVSPGGSSPDGVTWCDGPSSGVSRRLHGSGVGTNPVNLPADVAVKVASGEQLSMNLHLFNSGDTTLNGTSGMWIKTVPAESGVQMAEFVLTGTFALQIPEGRSTQSGRCFFGKPAKIFSLGPHMHQLGVHMRVTAHSTVGGEQVIHDGPFDFTHQIVYPVDQIELAAGDWLSIECTYDNTTGSTVFWGDSSLAEMCFASVGRYPAAGGPICAD